MAVQLQRLVITLFVLLTCAGPAAAGFSREFLDKQPLLVAPANGIELAYREVGAADAPPVILIMGLGASHVVWGDDFVNGLRDKGYRVLLFDNRDVGKSTRFEEWGQPTIWWQFLKRSIGFEVDAPYTLNDMAADTVALMDTLEIPEAHVAGASMGGMIAQVVAARYPNRVLSLTSIMSTTGNPDLPLPSDEASNSLQSLAEGDKDDEAMAEYLHRGFYPSAMPRQLMAIMKTGDRSEEVSTIKVPSLVLHGEEDTLLPPAHGRHTARLIVGSKMVVYPGMGHNMPDEVVPQILAEMADHIGKPPRANSEPSTGMDTEGSMPGDNLFGPLH